MERGQKLKLLEVDDETHDSFLALPTPATGGKHEQPSIQGSSPICSTSIKIIDEEREFSSLNTENPESHHRAFLVEKKRFHTSN